MAAIKPCLTSSATRASSCWRWRPQVSHLGRRRRLQLLLLPVLKLKIRCLNTFLPYAEFDRSMQCLDNRRLGKQRAEAWQILRIVQASAIPVPGTAWANAPAVRMWRGYPEALSIYYNFCLQEWQHRGFKNVILQPVVIDHSSPELLMPPWLGEEALHASHRSNLLRKQPEHYNQFGWREPPTLPYFWPVPLS